MSFHESNIYIMQSLMLFYQCSYFFFLKIHHCEYLNANKIAFLPQTAALLKHVTLLNNWKIITHLLQNKITIIKMKLFFPTEWKNCLEWKSNPGALTYKVKVLPIKLSMLSILCRTAVFGKTELNVEWLGNGLIMKISVSKLQY